MKFVEIYKLQNDGTQKTIAVCKLEGGVVVCEGDEILTGNLADKGIADYSGTGREPNLFPKDGLRFLEQLKFNFKSGYLNASDIKEE